LGERERERAELDVLECGWCGCFSGFAVVSVSLRWSFEVDLGEGEG
jgi:hypothetical protein